MRDFSIHSGWRNISYFTLMLCKHKTAVTVESVFQTAQISTLNFTNFSRPLLPYSHTGEEIYGNHQYMKYGNKKYCGFPSADRH